MKKENQKFIIIDSNALIHRAFHALPPMTNKDGVMVNAVYGFTAILLKSIKDIKPDYIVATFDMKGKTIRHEEFADYKAGRTKQPDELYDQMPIVKEVLKAFNIPIFEKAGYEADDLIGTITTMKAIDRPDIDSIILTGDKDMFQLVDNNTFVLAPTKGMSDPTLYDENKIIEKMNGISPSQIIDYKALRGDPSDNIPGVKGIGEKGAINLLNDFKTLDNIYQHIDSVKISERNKKLLIEHKDEAFLSKKLATIITDVPLDFKLDECKFGDLDQTQIIKLFQDLNFKRLMTQLSILDSGFKITDGQSSLFDKPTKEQSLNQPTQKYKLILTTLEAADFIKNLAPQTEFCFNTETTAIDPFSAELLGISFAWQKNEAYYLPKEVVLNVKQELLPIFKNKDIKKIGHNIKYDLEILAQNGFELQGLYFDTMIASYLLNHGNRQHNLDTVAFTELGYQTQPLEDLIGSGKNQINMAEVSLEKLSWYSCEEADITYQIYQKLKPELKAEGMFGLFEELEMPLIAVLADLEKNGIKLNLKLLKELAHDTDSELKVLEKKIFKAVGSEFNISSPLQLKDILFDKLKISTLGIGKTKTGISTAAGELEKLKGQHPVIDLILDFRELAKLKNTYLDALPKLINKKDKRVHTSFNQTVAATGRLSSSNPNLQNIPIRTERGQKIRGAFIVETGYKILKADYSQMELRIIASLANDAAMVKIFLSGGDIHTMTAALINNLEPQAVTKEIRRTAKEINFGVLYGMGAWGLSTRSGISHGEAQDFIAKYFQTFKEVKKWLDETIIMTKEKGYVETLYGRRRYLPEINSHMPQVRSQAERMAVNMPIQGTQADIIKLAMIKIHQELPKISPHSKMILQVHDELVFEVPKKETAVVAKLVRDCMCSVMDIKVPIEVEISIGDNWGDTDKI